VVVAYAHGIRTPPVGRARQSLSNTVKTLYNDAGRTADRIVIPMVLLYMESRVGLISKKKEADPWLSISKGRRASTSRTK
jgi:hypothetical protein